MLNIPHMFLHLIDQHLTTFSACTSYTSYTIHNTQYTCICPVLHSKCVCVQFTTTWGMWTCLSWLPRLPTTGLPTSRLSVQLSGSTWAYRSRSTQGAQALLVLVLIPRPYSSCRDDIMLGEKKVSGTAAKLGRESAYHHCTLLVIKHMAMLGRFSLARKSTLVEEGQE